MFQKLQTRIEHFVRRIVLSVLRERQAIEIRDQQQAITRLRATMEQQIAELKASLASAPALDASSLESALAVKLQPQIETWTKLQGDALQERLTARERTLCETAWKQIQLCESLSKNVQALAAQFTKLQTAVDSFTTRDQSRVKRLEDRIANWNQSLMAVNPPLNIPRI